MSRKISIPKPLPKVAEDLMQPSQLPQRWRLMSDNDGHDYLVPVGKEVDFDNWVDSFNGEDQGDPDGYLRLGCQSLGCCPTRLTFTDPRID